MESADPEVVLDIGGVLFRTYATTLQTFPNTRLANLTRDSTHYKPKRECYFFDRNPNLFHFILDLYRTGHLHLPTHMCYDSFRSELLFWDLDLKSVLSPCCAGSYHEFEEKKTVLDQVFKAALAETQSAENTKSKLQKAEGWQKWRLKAFIFLNWPESGTWATAWCIFNLFLLFLMLFNYTLTSCEGFTYDTSPAGYNLTGLHRHQYPVRVQFPYAWLRVIDLLINSFFTLEFMTRLVLAPERMKHLKTYYSIVEIICLVFYWSFTIFSSKAYLDGYYTHETGHFLNSILLVQLLRLFTSFKLASRFDQYKSVLLSIRYSMVEMFLIILAVISWTLFFAACVFYAEYRVTGSEFTNMPKAFYWAVITMTSVGYGDVVPSTTGGHVAAAMCSIVGLFLTGLAVSILSNNLSTFTLLTKQQRNVQKLMDERVLSKRYKSKRKKLDDEGLLHHAPSHDVKYKGDEDKIKGDPYDVIRMSDIKENSDDTLPLHEKPQMDEQLLQSETAS